MPFYNNLSLLILSHVELHEIINLLISNIFFLQGFNSFAAVLCQKQKNDVQNARHSYSPLTSS